MVYHTIARGVDETGPRGNGHSFMRVEPLDPTLSMFKEVLRK